MKKCNLFIVGILCLMLFSCKESDKPIMTIDEVNASWQTAPISGVKSAEIKDMVKAFQKQWPTKSIAMLLKDLQLPEDQQQYISVYDPENNYMSFAEGSDDREAESMWANVRQRSNGHQLFGITFSQPSSAVKSFLAFYDYDPSKGTLTPETSLANLFTPSFANVELGYTLPQEGDELVVNEYFLNWWTAMRHVYSWDGMKPCNPVAEFAEIDGVMETFTEDYMTYEMGDFSKYALIDIDEDGEPELWLSTDDEEYQAVLSIVEGGVTLAAGKDYKRHLIFYKGVVGDAGGCGTGCFYARYTKLKNSAPEFEFSDMQSYVFERDDMVHGYSKGEEELTNEEGEAILKSFGEPYDPVVEWHPFRVAE